MQMYMLGMSAGEVFSYILRIFSQRPRQLFTLGAEEGPESINYTHPPLWTPNF